ncbi:MAG TPA: XTP/dITP diphosphatase [Candidatus Avacidaminococcus intestinavium]|uniref:dITP/XTP pyrophosphatase n=1 Tax=Candidatus Avacidaminococcus intestinavium TaxID=2840684 RepID=A0A9D1SLH4_9FIRM|nr:XTP/dITP diphosphatase [Candidatus Avacidaminococcus intestinavium]
MKEIVIATTNDGKLKEFKELLKKHDVDILSLHGWSDIPAPEETGKTFAANARQKAIYYARKTGKICIADDSGLEVQTLNGAPGVHSARYAGEEADDEANNKHLLHVMKFHMKRTCRFRCALAVAHPSGKVLLETEGTCDGMLLHDKLGNEGFGYDPLFWSTELHKGLGEASMEEKNQVSHRAKAIKKLCESWDKIK